LPPFGGERGSLKGHETGFHARHPDYILFSNKLFDRIATPQGRVSFEKASIRFHLVIYVFGRVAFSSMGLANFFRAISVFEAK